VGACDSSYSVAIEISNENPCFYFSNVVQKLLRASEPHVPRHDFKSGGPKVSKMAPQSVRRTGPI